MNNFRDLWRFIVKNFNDWLKTNHKWIKEGRIYKFTPKIKPFEETLKLAMRLFGLKYFEVYWELQHWLKKHRLTQLHLELYVNWASWNCLTYVELAEEFDLTKDTVRAMLRTLRKKFPYLFQFGAKPHRLIHQGTACSNKGPRVGDSQEKQTALSRIYKEFLKPTGEEYQTHRRAVDDLVQLKFKKGLAE